MNKASNRIHRPLLLAISLFAIWGSNAFAQSTSFVRASAEYNLTSGVALKGYDPVSYFPEGGETPRPGSSAIQTTLDGVTYYFASTQNLATFNSDPEKYEPTYGGWCAYAMASGSKVDIQPEIFSIDGRRLHFFVSRRAKANFDADVVGYERNADANWKRISGEDARL